MDGGAADTTTVEVLRAALEARERGRALGHPAVPHRVYVDAHHTRSGAHRERATARPPLGHRHRTRPHDHRATSRGGRAAGDRQVSDGTIPGLLADTVDRFGAHRAVVDDKGEMTYSELADASRQFGAALVAADIEAGDRVAIWAPNSSNWIVAALGVFGTGAVLIPINTRFKGVEAGGI